MKKELQNKGNGLGFLRHWKVMTMTLLLLTFSISQMWGADFTITLDQFRTDPVTGIVKVPKGDLSLSGGTLQLSSGNKDFQVMTTNSDYKIKQIVFETTKAVISYGGEAISENTFTPENPATSFTLNLAASGGTAKISKMTITLTTATSETLEELIATAISDGVYTTGSSVITLSTEGGDYSSGKGVKLSKSKNTRSLTVATSTSYKLKFVTLYYYDAIFSRSITASTGSYTASTYTWTPGSTSTNTVTLTFATENTENTTIRGIYVGYESASSCSEPAAPTISGTASYNEGETITLTASHEGSNHTATTTYQWFKGATFATATSVQAAATGAAGYTFTKSAALSDAGTYWCEAANSTCKSHNVDGKAVTVNAAAVCPDGISISGTAAYTEGETIELTAALTKGNGTISYQWYKGSIAVGNEVGTGATFTKATCTTGDAGNYFCVATKDACSDEESSAYAVTVSEAIKYDVAFAAGTGATGEMSTLKRIEGATITIPAPTFTAPSGKYFSNWTIEGVVGKTSGQIGETFDMPAENVTLTANWVSSLEGNVVFNVAVKNTAASQTTTIPFYISELVGETSEGAGTVSDISKTDRSGKYATNCTSGKGVKFTFDVKDGFEFAPSVIAVQLASVSTYEDFTFTATLSDENSTVLTSNEIVPTSDGTLTTITFPAYNKSFKGTTTLLLSVCKTGDAGTYRIGKPITITGTITAEGACTAPTISWDGDQPENAYVSDGSKTFVMNSNYAAGIAPELSENSCGASIAVKPETDNKQWVVSFTGAGSVKITPKVVGDGTTVCAETVSGTAKTLTVTQAYDVTFNMNGHGASIAKQVVADGGKATAPYVADVADWVFGGWFTDAECTAGNEFDFANTTISADRPLYAKWTADACAGDRKSLSKVVLTSTSAGTVTGYNGDEYAGSAVINNLKDDDQTAEVDASHDGLEEGYKLNGSKSTVFATLKKGTFQEGDKVVVTITKANDAYKVESVAQKILDIYYGDSKDDATLLTTIEGVNAAGTYAYRLTAADVTAIGSKKGIGVYRPGEGRTQNPYVYSVEITGCRSFAVSHDVTFDMKSHGTQVAKQTIEVGAKVTEPAEQEVAGYIFGGWYKETTLVNKWNFSTDVMPDNDITLYAKWTEDPCTDRQSLSKVVLAAKDNGTVTGYNSKEYAGEAIIESLDNSEDADIIGDATKERGYKLNSGGKSIVMATLKKGTFQEGDKVIVGITKVNDQRTVDASTEIMTIYAGSDKDHMMEVATIKNVNAAGFYTYRLTAANSTAINEAGYKSIGLFRASSNGQNHYVYSVEITGCREWAIFHTLTFKNIDGTATIAAESLEKGAYASTVAPVAPKIAMKRFLGWAEATDGTPVDLTTYTITEDKTLYAVYEDIVCPTTGTVYKFQLKTDLTSGNIFTSAPGELTLNTTDHLSSMVNGEVTVNLASGKNTNRVQFYDDKAIGFANGDGASITLTLDCALATGDEIRFINYAGNGNKMNLSDGAHSLELNGNNAETVQKITVNSDWNGADELTLTRGGNTPKLTYFEIYRPAKYDVSFNMMGHGSAIADLEDVVEGSKIAAPSPAPTDADYSFAGWYKENTLENEWKFDVDVVETNTTLYAKWLDKSDATLKSLKYGETDIVLVVDQYTYDITLPSLTSSVPELTAETNNPNATKAIVNDTFDGEGNATSTVTVTPEVGADKVYTVNFARGIALEQVTVTTSMEWDWSAAGVTAEINNTNTPGLSGNDVVIANVPGVNNDADFNSQALKASGTNAIRTTYFQGKELNIKTDKEGMLIVDFSGTNTKARVLKVYDNADTEIAAWSYNSETRQVQQVIVPAGKVTLKAFEGESGNNARIYNLKFYVYDTERADSWIAPGELGTICYPNGHVVVGADVYQMAGVDSNNKFVFDEVQVTEPGKPYLFVAKSYDPIKFYKTTAAAAAVAGTSNGMVGTFSNLYLSTSDSRASKWYYFADTKFYSVAKYTGSTVSIPANRAYVDLNEPHPASAPKFGVRRISFDVQGTNAATGFENAEATEAPRKVMINGTLFILRGEKMYDATGRLVK